MRSKTVEGHRIVDRNFTEHLSIQQNVCVAEGRDKLAISNSAHSACCGDTSDPKAAEISATEASMNPRIASSTHQRNLGLLFQTTLGPEISTRFAQQFSSGLGAGGTFSCSWHSILLRYPECAVLGGCARRGRSLERTFEPGGQCEKSTAFGGFVFTCDFRRSVLLLREQRTIEKFAVHLRIAIAREAGLAIRLHSCASFVAFEMAAIWTEEPNLAGLGDFNPLR